MALFFLGSDWDPKSKECLEELKKAEITSNSSLLVVVLDYPELNDQEIATVKANHELKEKLHVSSFPQVILLNEDEVELNRYGYQGNLIQLMQQIKNDYFEYQVIEEELKQIANLNEKQLEIVYAKIKKYGIEAQQRRFYSLLPQKKYPIEALIDQYQALVFNNQEKEAAQIKTLCNQKKDAIEMKVRLTMIDFQHQSSKNRTVAIENLKNEVSDLDKHIANGVWQLHLILSEEYLKQNDLIKAKVEALDSLKSVNQEKEMEIKKLIQKIEHQMNQESYIE